MRSTRLFVILCCLAPGFSASLAVAQAHEKTRQMLPELHLLQPPWASPTMFRESILLLQAEEGGPLVGRLAFPIEELIEVRAADGSRTLAVGKDFQIGPDKRTLQFPATANVPYVKAAELYVPVGSPDSYAHRVGDPKQALMFHPGKWFHTRQFEVTYRRA